MAVRARVPESDGRAAVPPHLDTVHSPHHRDRQVSDRSDDRTVATGVMENAGDEMRALAAS